jgi:hypothetical protein
MRAHMRWRSAVRRSSSRRSGATSPAGCDGASSPSFLWEASIVAQAPDLADRIAVRFLEDLERSNEIRAGDWARRPLSAKVGQRAAGALEPWT